MAYRVFLSYSTKDLQTAGEVRKILMDCAIDVFMAEYSIAAGQTLEAAITSAISNCDLFLLLWSEHSRASDWVPQEIGAARAFQKTLLPFLLAPKMPMPAFLAGIKYLAAGQNVEDALKQLKDDVVAKAAMKGEQQRLLLIGLSAVVLLLLARD